MTELLEKLKQDMLDAQKRYQDYLDAHKQPMTEKELEENKKLHETYQSPLGDHPSERYTVKFDSVEEIEKMNELSDEMIEAQRTFNTAYTKATLFERGMTIEEAHKQHKELGEEFLNLVKLNEAMKRVNTPMIGMFDLNREIETHIAEVQEQRNNVWQEIIAFQEKCDHNDGCAWDYVGHDSHKDHYKCNICGKEMSI